MEKYVKNLSEVKAVKPGVDVVILDGGALKCAKIVDTMVYNTANGWFVEYTMNDGTKYDNTVKFMVSEEDVNGANKLSRVEIHYLDADNGVNISGCGSYSLALKDTEANGALQLYNERGEEVIFLEYNLQLRKDGRYYIMRTDAPYNILYRSEATARDAAREFNGKSVKELLTLTAEQRQAWESFRRALEGCGKNKILFYYDAEVGKISPFNGDGFKGFNWEETDNAVTTDVISWLDYCHAEFYVNHGGAYCEFNN